MVGRMLYSWIIIRIQVRLLIRGVRMGLVMGKKLRGPLSLQNASGGCPVGRRTLDLYPCTISTDPQIPPYPKLSPTHLPTHLEKS